MLFHTPLWAIFGFLAALASATMMLLQERFKTEALPMAFWSKVASIIVMLPFVIHYGLPKNLLFYGLLTANSLMWVISDVIFYRGVGRSGAGVISRLIPVSTIFSFLLWFAIDWSSASAYLARPLYAVSICLIFCASGLFAWRLKDCTLTLAAFRSIWFVIAANLIGSLSTKYILMQVTMQQGTYAYVFCTAIVMVAMWLVYFFVRHPLPTNIMFAPPAIGAGLTVGVVAAFMVLCTVYALYNIDNPAYVSAVKYSDAALILIYYRVAGIPRTGRIWAGLGIVACAASLVIIKATH